MTDSTRITTRPDAHQPPGNQKHSPKAISDIALFCSPFFFSWPRAVVEDLSSTWQAGCAIPRASVSLPAGRCCKHRAVLHCPVGEQTANTQHIPKPHGAPKGEDSIHYVALTDTSDR